MYNIETLKPSIYMYEQVGRKIMSIPGGIRTHDLWIRSPTRYPLRYGDLCAQSNSSVTCQLTANGCSLKNPGVEDVLYAIHNMFVHNKNWHHQ